MGSFSFDCEDDEIPIAFKKKFGDLRIPTNRDVIAWRDGFLAADRRHDIKGRPIVDESRKAPVAKHPVTGKFAAPWKDAPTGRGMAEQLRVRFKPGDPRAVAAGRRSTPAKRLSSRENLKLANEARKKKQRPRAVKPEGVSGA